MSNQICKKCFLNKSFEEYYNQPNSKSGIQTTCKSCVKERVKIRHHKVKSKLRIC